MTKTRSHSNTIAPERLSLVEEYLKKNPTHGSRRIAVATGIPRGSMDRVLNELRRQGRLFRPKADPSAAASVRNEETPPPRGVRYDRDTNTAEAVVERPVTVDELLAKCKVDTARWVVDRFVCNTWNVATKNDAGEVTVTPLFQVKVWLVKRPGVEEADALKSLLASLKKRSPIRPRVGGPFRKLAVDDPHLLEISVPDLHHGKLTWHKETGEDYDSTISAELHQQAVENLWLKSSVFPIQKILLVVGHDFFNVNSAANTTAAGTPQQEDGRWAKTFRTGVETLVRAIEFLRGKAPGGIEVRVIRGNHDSERIFMAGEVLAAMYANVADVEVVNNPIKRQYIRWGQVLLGLGHGDGVKHDKLPLIMAGEAPEMWAQTTWREWHLGHLHHKRETQFHAGNEHGPVRVRILPSLTTADDWHYTNGFVGAKRAAEAYLWSFRRGYVGHLSWSPEPNATGKAA